MKPVPQDRMFHVLVLGGIALVAGGGCGNGAGGFPSGAPAQADASADADASPDTGNPFTSDAERTDAVPDAKDASADGFCFPCEGPQ
jgi:hypothetical protein